MAGWSLQTVYNQAQKPRWVMPEISRFYGIIVAIFYDDHSPPHFHARYGRHQVIIDIDKLSVIRGSLPPRALAMTLEWASRHQAELTEDWRLAEQHAPLNPIEPLE